MPTVLIHCRPSRVRRLRRRLISGDGSVATAPEVHCSCVHGSGAAGAGRAADRGGDAYQPSDVAAYYDHLGAAVWDRFDRTLGDRISLALHTEALEHAIPHGSRVLEIGAGPGRFTEVLHRLGCRTPGGDLSA